MPIDFQDLIRSTRADGKLMAADALTGAFIKSVAVDGNALVATVQQADGTEAAVRFHGPSQPGDFLRRATYAAGAVPVEADFLRGGAVTTRTTTVTIPTYGGSHPLAFWQEAGGLELTGIVAGRRIWSQFSGPFELTVDGDAGHFWVSEPATNVGARRFEMEFGSELQVFRRYFARRLEADGRVFVAADFTAADVSANSLTSTMTVPAAATTRELARAAGTRYYGYAVPDSQPDIIVVQTVGGFGGALAAERQPGTIQIDGIAHKVWSGTRLYYGLANTWDILIVQQENER